MSTTALNGDRKRRIRRNAWLLGLLAVVFYVIFIGLSVLRSQGS